MKVTHEEQVWRKREHSSIPFIVVSGPSGGGKTTLCNALMKRITALALLIEHTSRKKRSKESDQLEYYFVEAIWFTQCLHEKALVAYADRYDNLYALSCGEVERVCSVGGVPLVVLDVHLALKFRTAYPLTCAVFVGPRTVDEIAERLKSRGDSTVDIAKRLALVEEELQLRDRFDVDADGYIPLDEIVGAVIKHLRRASSSNIQHGDNGKDRLGLATAAELDKGYES